MAASSIVDRVVIVVSDMAPMRDSEVTPSSRLRQDLGYDSLSLLELAAALEDEFGLSASAELDAEVAAAVADVAVIVSAKLKATGV